MLKIENYTQPADFNWLAVLKDLAAGEKLTRQTHKILGLWAACWPTCACGQLCHNLPRNNDNSPLDLELRILGREFYFAITQEYWQNAISAFHRIENRTCFLLTEINTAGAVFNNAPGGIE